MGEERGLRSTHPVDLLPPYARNVSSESWRRHCRSRRLAVPMTGPVPHVGNFRNTLALLSIQWPFGLPIPVKHTSFRFSPLLYKTDSVHDCLNTARVVCTLSTGGKDFSLAEPGKALTHRVPQSCISRSWRKHGSCRTSGAAGGVLLPNSLGNMRTAAVRWVDI